MKYCKACNRYWGNHRIVCPECLQSLPDNLIEEQAGTAVSNDKFIEEVDKMFNRQILKYNKRIAELEKPILCAKCNDHIIADDGAVCEICADTMDTIITELQARIKELEAKISAAKRGLEMTASCLPDTSGIAIVIKEAVKYLTEPGEKEEGTDGKKQST